MLSSHPDVSKAMDREALAVCGLSLTCWDVHKSKLIEKRFQCQVRFNPAQTGVFVNSDTHGISGFTKRLLQHVSHFTDLSRYVQSDGQ